VRDFLLCVSFFPVFFRRFFFFALLFLGFGFFAVGAHRLGELFWESRTAGIRNRGERVKIRRRGSVLVQARCVYFILFCCALGRLWAPRTRFPVFFWCCLQGFCIVCAISKLSREKKLGPSGEKKSHPFPNVFSWKGSARNFSTVKKQRFLCF